MKCFKDRSVLLALLVIAALVPTQAHAIVSLPEPASMSLLAIGAAGLGAAEWIRRRRNKDK